MPQPITTTGVAVFWDSEISSPQEISPAVSALELQVVEEEAGQASFDRTAAEEAHHLLQQVPGQLHRDAPVRRDRRRSPGGHGGAPLPCPRPTCLPGCPTTWPTFGWMSPRIHDGSPLMCTSEHMSAGMLTSSSARAMASSPSSNGSPAKRFLGYRLLRSIAAQIRMARDAIGHSVERVVGQFLRSDFDGQSLRESTHLPLEAVRNGTVDVFAWKVHGSVRSLDDICAATHLRTSHRSCVSVHDNAFRIRIRRHLFQQQEEIRERLLPGNVVGRNRVAE